MIKVDRAKKNTKAEELLLTEKLVRELVLHAVAACGAVLRFAPLNMRSDREVVMAAVANDPHAWVHAAPLESEHYEREVLEVRRAGLEKEHAAVVARHRRSPSTQRARALA